MSIFTWDKNGLKGKPFELSKFKFKNSNSRFAESVRTNIEFHDEALEIKSSYVSLNKGSNDFTISSTASGKADISSEEISTLAIVDHTFSEVKVTAGSSLILEDDATITTLTCSSTSIIDKGGTVTNAAGYSQAQ